MKDKVTKADYTHLLQCRHCVSVNHCRDYDMYCILLGETSNGKAKMLVMGERNWKLRDNPKLSIRYVDFDKLTERL